jgi:hypothetical protein
LMRAAGKKSTRVEQIENENAPPRPCSPAHAAAAQATEGLAHEGPT